MTKGIIDMLNLPSLDELVGEDDGDAMKEMAAASASNEAVALDLQNAEAFAELVKGTDHGEAMNEVHDEALKHARDIVDLGFNIDPSKARGMFEQGANFYKIAIDAANSKRDAELKAMKLILDHRKFEFEKSQATGKPTTALATIDTEATVVTTHNDLIRQYHESKKRGDA
jgi:hypothetical protein